VLALLALAVTFKMLVGLVLTPTNLLSPTSGHASVRPSGQLFWASTPSPVASRLIAFPVGKPFGG